ncbi:hypothetical protein [Pseudomonas vanderleydeniana]|uniref:Uncharacterized protein n=1 Tax=Pseudomonas vanderleydeniana TaxID=2745495 RepID=A0A9E6TRP3_9PSED|nr:hypothetical protein [Pseudomonas vanderleydeniana]QXI28079.1 hypothetical protein HU752_030070 [Pseudomonas vanderleydeniana]
MDVKIGGTALAIILAGLAITFGLNECQRGPLNPELPDNLSDEQTAWLTLEHRIKRADPALAEVSRDQQALTILYRPGKVADNEEAWVPRMLRTVGQGLAAVNNAPGGKQYAQVTIKAHIVAADDVELVYGMDSFDAIKTQQGGYINFASMPRELKFSRETLAQAREYCRDPSGWGFYPEFCQRVGAAKAAQR